MFPGHPNFCCFSFDPSCTRGERRLLAKDLGLLLALYLIIVSYGYNKGSSLSFFLSRGWVFAARQRCLSTSSLNVLSRVRATESVLCEEYKL